MSFLGGSQGRGKRLASCVGLAVLLSCGGSTVGGGGSPPPGDDAGTTSPEASTTSDGVAPGDAATGPTVDNLLFAVVGDTRPPSPDDTSGYPTAIIDQIFTRISGLNPLPQFVIGTGDYQYSSDATTASTQMDLYLSARKKFSGPFYPTMGNHECTGATDSNCGPNSTDGMTGNYTTFLSKMLPSVAQSKPFYEVDLTGTNGAWTAKFLFVAANAWGTDQQTWLDTAMSRQTTYTFIVRHESASANTAPGVDPSEAIMFKHPYTLAIVGHTHTYRRESQQQIIIGNGGAPISGGVNYGFGLFSQRPDGAIQVEMIDYQSGQSSQQFAVKADGSSA